MQIRELAADEDASIGEVAAMLIEGFREGAPEAFPDLQTAIAEVRESFAANRITRLAVDDHAEAVGWIGGIRLYQGHTWELHPLVVRPDKQGRGIGRALVRDFEQRVVERGGRTIFLGTDDEQGRTSIGGVDLCIPTFGAMSERFGIFAIIRTSSIKSSGL